uniref:Ymf73 n=1 Tax=Ichthyophthirius multifiliis TaxID=5932 RepID=G1FLE8_ICHMU|nr:Ymf73 [Ichthyophthirius multifiliis]AEL89290.1 Ymf73 [Ichthyophthirius multifiliis]
MILYKKLNYIFFKYKINYFNNIIFKIKLNNYKLYNFKNLTQLEINFFLNLFNNLYLFKNFKSNFLFLTDSLVIIYIKKKKIILKYNIDKIKTKVYIFINKLLIIFNSRYVFNFNFKLRKLKTRQNSKMNLFLDFYNIYNNNKNIYLFLFFTSIYCIL